MATSKGYLSFILDQLSSLPDITHRQMMGEYMIYYRGRLAAYLCDDRFLVKPTKSALAYVEEHVFEPPYEGAKDMLVIQNVDDGAYLCGLLDGIYPELPMPKKRK